MGRKELFEEIDERLGKVVTLDEYGKIFELEKMLIKIDVRKLPAYKTTLGNAKRFLIDFILLTGLINTDIFKESIIVGQELEDIEIDYLYLYDSIKEILLEDSEVSNNNYLKPFLSGVLNALISVYLDRNMVDTKVIEAYYNHDLDKKHENIKDICIASVVKKECREFCEEHAIGFVSKEGMPKLDAYYTMSTLTSLAQIDIENAISESFIESLSYFVSIIFYNRCRDNFEACLNIFRTIYQKDNHKINSITDLIPLLNQMGFPINEIDGKIEIDFDELNNQISIMNESMKEKALIIK